MLKSNIDLRYTWKIVISESSDVLPFPTGAAYEVTVLALHPNQAVHLFLTAADHNLAYEPSH